MIRPRTWLALAVVLASPALGADGVRFRVQEIDNHVGDVCYAVATADVDGDTRPDVVAVAGDAVVWYQNPTWARHDIIRGVTERDNVCLQPFDIDADGRVDFALGAAWRPSDTRAGGTLQWLTRTGVADGAWRVIPILSEPTLHRVRWGDTLGTGKKQLIVAPLQGRGTKGPNWGEGAGSRILSLSIPPDPVRDAWPVEVVEDRLHTVHNLQLVDTDGDGRDEILLGAWEGVFQLNRNPNGWVRTQLGTGNQDAKPADDAAPKPGTQADAKVRVRPASPFKGASEIKRGRRRDGSVLLATIEPWHGTQVVVYTPPAPGQTGLWTRQVIDEPVQWGHAVWFADLDGDGDEELIVGQRDKSADPSRDPKGPGVLVYDPVAGSNPVRFDRTAIDDGGVAVEDLVAADLDGDGRPEIIAGGRATHNVRIYWNGKPE